jgi:hypothetical protein
MVKGPMITPIIDKIVARMIEIGDAIRGTNTVIPTARGITEDTQLFEVARTL